MYTSITALVVDDSQTIQKIVKSALVSMGFTSDKILFASNGHEALNLAKGHKPEIILTDWNMPVMNGLEFVKSLRQEGLHAPVIMITTEGRQEDVVLALKAGVNDYIVKPFRPEILADKIKKVL